MTTTNVSLLLLLCLIALASGCCKDEKCNCEPNCWEKCFLNPPNSYKHAYLEIYQMVKGIQNLYAPCFKPHGTAYMMDADVPSGGFTPYMSSYTLYRYQRNLATIIAMTQPVGDECNPFCANKFYRNWAYYSHSWPCQDRCEAYNFFNSQSMSSFHSNKFWKTQPSWVRGGEILADVCFNQNKNRKGHECMECANNELLISFTNSPIYPTPSANCGSKYYCAAIGINPATYENMDQWDKTSGPVFHLPSSKIYYYAANRITSCINTQCCRYKIPNTWDGNNFLSGRDANITASRAVRSEVEEFQFLGQSDDRLAKGPQTFKGTFEEFEKAILEPAVGGGDIEIITKKPPVLKDFPRLRPAV